MEVITRGLSHTKAIDEYRRLLARDDLAGEPWSAVLRCDLSRRTLLLSRFDLPERRLLPDDKIDFQAIYLSPENADETTLAIVAARKL